MATFIWDPAVQWPPPAHILLGYDVVAPGGVLLSSRRDRRGDIEEESMTQPFLALITPLSGDAGGGRPDNSLPGGGGHPGNRPPGSWDGTHPGNRPPGSWGGPVDPSWGVGGGPVDPGWGSGGGEHPGNRPPGSEHPGNRPPGSFPGYPTGGPIVPPQGGTDVPPEDFSPPPPPEDISSQYVVSVYDPRTMQWTTKTYPPR